MGLAAVKLDMEILRDLLPEVKALPRDKAMHHIMDDLGLLARCFVAYRENPERFRQLMVAPKTGDLVVNPQDPLTCGRSFDDIVGLVVRTAAKRHFMQTIDGDLRPFRAGRFLTTDEMNSVQLMMSAFGKKFERGSDSTKGRELYKAMGDNLRYDWQIPLMPEYAKLPVSLVKKLGEQILDYKLASELQQLRQNPKDPPPPSQLKPKQIFVPPSADLIAAQEAAKAAVPVEAGPGMASEAAPVGFSGGNEANVVQAPVTAPIPASAGSDRRARLDQILTPDGKLVNPRAFNNVLLDPAILAILPPNLGDMRVGEVLSKVSSIPIKLLVNDLGLRQDQLAVLLIWTVQGLGKDDFLTLYGSGDKIASVQRMVEAMRGKGITQDSSLKDVAIYAQSIKKR